MAMAQGFSLADLRPQNGWIGATNVGGQQPTRPAMPPGMAPIRDPSTINFAASPQGDALRRQATIRWNNAKPRDPSTINFASTPQGDHLRQQAMQRWTAAQSEAPQSFADIMRMKSGGGGLADIASMGRYGDTELAHINPREKMMLERAGGSGTINPATGLREYWENSRDGGDNGSGAHPSYERDYGNSDVRESLGMDRDDSGPGWGSRLAWGLSGLVLSGGNPMLAAAAARYGPDAWSAISRELGRGRFAGQQSPVSSSQISQAAERLGYGNTQRGGDLYDDAGSRGGLGGSAPRHPVLGRLDPSVRPQGGPGGSATANEVDGAAPKPKPKPRRVVNYEGDLTRYGRGGQGGEHVWFDRWY